MYIVLSAGDEEDTQLWASDAMAKRLDLGSDGSAVRLEE